MGVRKANYFITWQVTPLLLHELSHVLRIHDCTLVVSNSKNSLSAQSWLIEQFDETSSKRATGVARSNSTKWRAMWKPLHKRFVKRRVRYYRGKSNTLFSNTIGLIVHFTEYSTDSSHAQRELTCTHIGRRCDLSILLANMTLLLYKLASTIVLKSIVLAMVKIL